MTGRYKRYMFLFIIAAVLSGELVLNDNETPTERAYKECRPCGLTKAEIDQLIDDCRHSTLDRQEQIELFKSTFTPDETGPEDCTPCIEAILDAARASDTGSVQESSQNSDDHPHTPCLAAWVPVGWTATMSSESDQDWPSTE